MGFPEPDLTFTIPSIHDDLTLDCRIYLPQALRSGSVASVSAWHRKGAIVAHPYAPLGGSYEDHVVNMVAADLRKAGFIVGLFNFRGAGSSKGRTSWTGRAELADYISVAGLMVTFLRSLDLPTLDLTPLPSPTRFSFNRFKNARKSKSSPSHSPDQPSSPAQPSPSLPSPQSPIDPAEAGKPIKLILGGYSYGALVTAHLPSTGILLSSFKNPVQGTAASEIILRANHLATQISHEIASEIGAAQEQSDSKHGKDQPDRGRRSLVVGGEETNANVRRSSRGARHSMDAFHHSLNIPHRVKEHVRRRSGEESRAEPSTKESETSPLSGSSGESEKSEDRVETSYLLISQVLGPVSNLLSFHHKSDGEEKLVQCPTLSVYGNEDVFTSAKKMRERVNKLSSLPQSRFVGEEIDRAGHFWSDGVVIEQLRGAIWKWVTKTVLA